MSYAAMLCMEADAREAAMEGQAEEEACEVDRLRAIYERGVARNIDGDVAYTTVDDGRELFRDECDLLESAIEFNDGLWREAVADWSIAAQERTETQPPAAYEMGFEWDIPF